MYSQWYSSGIKYLEDIYDITANSFYTFRRLKEKYALSDMILKYLTLLPIHGKLILKSKTLIYQKSHLFLNKY